MIMGHRWLYKAPTTHDHRSSGATRPKLLTDVTIRSKTFRDSRIRASAVPAATGVPPHRLPYGTRLGARHFVSTYRHIDTSLCHLVAVTPASPSRRPRSGSADGDGTVLELEYGRLAAGLSVGYGYGWEDFLDRLAALLAGGDPALVSWEESQEVLKPLWSAAAEARRRDISRSGRYDEGHDRASSGEPAGAARR